MSRSVTQYCRMGETVLITVVGVGAALTKMFLRACDEAPAADLIGDGQELLGTLLRVSRRSGGSKDQIERSVSKALAARIQEIHKHRCGQDIDRQLLSGVCTEVEILLNEITNDGGLVLSAVLNPDSFPAEFHSRASQRRMNVEERAEPYFDELVEAVTTQYAALAPWSQRFQIEALRSILAGIDELQDDSRRSLQAHEMTHEMLDTVLSNLAEVNRHEDKPRRILFGGRPDVAIGSSFVARVEQDQLNELITDTTKQRTVLVGMRGCGKTQLAAALAKQCEDANWSLVAWVNAVSPESIKSALVELAKELKLDTSDQPTQEQIIARCLNSLRSSEASDRLVVFDNVESINDLRGLVPTGQGLHVVATTTNSTGWEYQDWTTIKVGVFDHNESIDYLLTVTKSNDHDTADALAERLGDLPLALAQAAATARNGDLTLGRYLDRLDSYGGERVIRPVPGDYYTEDVATALWMAVEDALESLAEPTRRSARCQLGALALLAESGVPTRWLDPTIKQQGNEELQGANQEEDEYAHDALTELIQRSIVQQSADGTTTMLHRLQAQAFRESWNANEAAEACRLAAILLGRVKIDSISHTNTYFRRQETLALIEQLRAIGEQIYSQHLLASTQVRFALNHALTQAYDLNLSHEGITLSRTVLLVVERFAPDTEYILTLYNNLAVVYHCAGYLDVAITLYEDNLKRSIDFHGAEHFETLYKHSNLLYAYRTAGRLTEAIAQSKQLIKVGTKVLGADAPLVLTLRNNLASCYELDGQLDRATNLYEQVLDDHVRVLGSDDPNTLATRNNLASAYQSDGRIDDAINLYTEVVAIATSVQGENHPNTLTWRNNLAHALQIAGSIDEAISQFAKLVAGYSRILGGEHPDTLTAGNNLALAYAKGGDFPEAIKRWEIIYADSKRLLGEAHPFTATVRENLEAARQELAEQVDSSPTEEHEEER